MSDFWPRNKQGKVIINSMEQGHKYINEYMEPEYKRKHANRKREINYLPRVDRMRYIFKCISYLRDEYDRQFLTHLVALKDKYKSHKMAYAYMAKYIYKSTDTKAIDMIKEVEQDLLKKVKAAVNRVEKFGIVLPG